MRLLLAYLALQRDGQAQRLQAAAFLWGDRDDRLARQNLRQLLSRLRAALGHDLADLLTSDAETVRLNLSWLAVDALEFQSYARSSQCGDLAAAASIYNGVFLSDIVAEGEEVNAWIDAERTRLAALAAGVYGRLASAMDAECRTAEALEYARKLTALDPFVEASQRLAIRMLARHEGMPSAVAYAKSVERRFNKEFGVGFEPETLQLLQELRTASVDDLCPVHSTNQDSPAPMVGVGRSRPAVTVKSGPSIAVLPFVDLGGDPNLAHIAEGLAEELTSGLSRLRWLLVVARAATLKFAGGVQEASKTARDLGVRYLVAGSIRASAGRVRLHAQLFDAMSGVQIWSQRYDRSLADVFDLQDDITEHVVATIEPALYAQESYRAASRAPADLGNWGRAVQAIGLIHQFERAANEEARALLEKALVDDPHYTHARALLAWALFWAQQCFWIDDRAEAARKSDEHARIAMQQDQHEPWARMVFGFLLSQRRDHSSALRELRIMLELNPNFALGRMLLGWAHVRAGTFDAAVRETERALRLRPADNFASVYYSTHGLALLAARRFEEALPFLQASVHPHTEYMGHYNVLISCYGHLGMIDEAQALLSYRHARLNRPFTLRGAREALSGFAHAEIFIEGLRKTGMQEARS